MKSQYPHIIPDDVAEKLDGYVTELTDSFRRAVAHDHASSIVDDMLANNLSDDAELERFLVSLGAITHTSPPCEEFSRPSRHERTRRRSIRNTMH